jgi:CRISPR-associated protein Cas1
MPQDLRILPEFTERLSYLYVERARVERHEGSIALLADAPCDGLAANGEDTMTEVPVCDVAVLMLGPGTSATHAAMSVLARHNCLVAWVGEQGVRAYAFAIGGSRSSERLLRQAKAATDPELRLQMVRRLYGMRFPGTAGPDLTVEELRGMEGHRVRQAYAQAAERVGIAWQRRDTDNDAWEDADDPNRALSAAYACIYGVCHAAVLGMGYSPALGFIHTGHQLSFVYDLADLYKLDLALPVAFEQAAQGPLNLERRVRQALRDRFAQTRFLGRVADDLVALFDGVEEDGAAEGAS